MQTLNKLTDDLLLGFDFDCLNRFFNIRNFKSLIIKIYTLNSNNFIEASYRTLDNFVNIIKIDDNYFVKIDQTDLEQLENGQLRQKIEYNMIAPDFQGGDYSASDNILIDIILTDQTIINKIEKGGCCK